MERKKTTDEADVLQISIDLTKNSHNKVLYLSPQKRHCFYLSFYSRMNPCERTGRNENCFRFLFSLMLSSSLRIESIKGEKDFL